MSGKLITDVEAEQRSFDSRGYVMVAGPCRGEEISKPQPQPAWPQSRKAEQEADDSKVFKKASAHSEALPKVACHSLHAVSF